MTPLQFTRARPRPVEPIVNNVAPAVVSAATPGVLRVPVPSAQPVPAAHQPAVAAVLPKAMHLTMCRRRKRTQACTPEERENKRRMKLLQRAATESPPVPTTGATSCAPRASRARAVFATVTRRAPVPVELRAPITTDGIQTDKLACVYVNSSKDAFLARIRRIAMHDRFVDPTKTYCGLRMVVNEHTGYCISKPSPTSPFGFCRACTMGIMDVFVFFGQELLNGAVRAGRTEPSAEERAAAVDAVIECFGTWSFTCLSHVFTRPNAKTQPYSRALVNARPFASGAPGTYADIFDVPQSVASGTTSNILWIPKGVPVDSKLTPRGMRAERLGTAGDRRLKRRSRAKPSPTIVASSRDGDSSANGDGVMAFASNDGDGQRMETGAGDYTAPATALKLVASDMATSVTAHEPPVGITLQIRFDPSMFVDECLAPSVYLNTALPGTY